MSDNTKYNVIIQNLPDNGFLTNWTGKLRIDGLDEGVYDAVLTIKGPRMEEVPSPESSMEIVAIERTE